MTSKSFTSDKIVGVILFEQTMNRKIEGKYTSEYLWDKGILSFLKIDKGFLNETNTSESGKFILKKIIEMADGLGVRVICEGVETKEQAEMLMEIGCNYAQGFLYSKPIPMGEFIEKYNVPIHHGS